MSKEGTWKHYSTPVYIIYMKLHEQQRIMQSMIIIDIKLGMRCLLERTNNPC